MQKLLVHYRDLFLSTMVISSPPRAESYEVQVTCRKEYSSFHRGPFWTSKKLMSGMGMPSQIKSSKDEGAAWRRVSWAKSSLLVHPPPAGPRGSTSIRERRDFAHFLLLPAVFVAFYGIRFSWLKGGIWRMRIMTGRSMFMSLFCFCYVGSNF